MAGVKPSLIWNENNYAGNTEYPGTGTTTDPSNDVYMHIVMNSGKPGSANDHQIDIIASLVQYIQFEKPGVVLDDLEV
jgi:hypothetical protein